MKKYLIGFDNYCNGEIIESENDNNAQSMIENAMIIKINKKDFLGIYTQEELNNSMSDDGVDISDYEETDKWMEEKNYMYFDLSEYAELESAKWIFYLNMDFITIREVNE